MSFLDYRTPRCVNTVDVTRVLKRGLGRAFVSVSLLGTPVVMAGSAMAGCNSGDVGQDALLSTSACQGTATGYYSTAVGFVSEALDISSTAFGRAALAKGANATVLGANAGPSSAVAGVTAVGAAAGHLAGKYSTAVGGGTNYNTNTQAAGDFSIAVGGGDGTPFTPSTGPAIDLNGALASGYISLAIGTASQATGGGSSAIGLGSKASGTDSAAYGEFSAATGASSIAMGLFSAAAGTASLAFGPSAKATKTKAVAIGANSVANIANTVSVGSNSIKRRIVNVAPGIAANDVVTLAQLQAAVAAVASRGVASPPIPELAVSVVNVGRRSDEDMQRRLSALEALVKQQQERIAQLESRGVAEGRVR